MPADPDNFLRVAKAVQLVLLGIAFVVSAGGATVLFAFYRGPGQAYVMAGAGVIAIGSIALLFIFISVMRSMLR
jgi:Na+/melibiose symporter-like transporter